MFRNEQNPYDLVVVLGSGVAEDHSLPEDSLMRTQAAAILYELRIATRLLLSGGRTMGQELPTEAEAMYTWLQDQKNALKRLFFPDKNVNERMFEDSVSLDNHAISTTDNLRGLERLLKENPGLHKIAIVTNAYHAERVKLMVKNRNLPVDVITAEQILIQQGGKSQEERVKKYYNSPEMKTRQRRELIARLLLKLDPRGIIPHLITLRNFQKAEFEDFTIA